MLVRFSAPVQVLNVHTLQLADPSIAAKLVFPSVSRRPVARAQEMCAPTLVDSYRARRTKCQWPEKLYRVGRTFFHFHSRASPPSSRTGCSSNPTTSRQAEGRRLGNRFPTPVEDGVHRR